LILPTAPMDINGHGAEDTNQFYDADGTASNLTSPSSEQAPILTDEERESLRVDLLKTEEEINTLRQVLNARIKHASELRRKLGISAWKEMTHDVQEGIKSVKETPAFQKTEEILHTVGEKTSSALNQAGKKIGELRNTPYFKSFEGKVGSAYTSVKTKIASSTSIGQLSGHTANNAGGGAMGGPGGLTSPDEQPLMSKSIPSTPQAKGPK